jgi:hypothetical protein
MKTVAVPRIWTAGLLALLALLFSAGEAMAQDNAGIFFFGPPPTPEQVAAAAPGATVTIEKDGPITRTTLRWPDVSLQINMNDPFWKRDVQLSGMRGYISRFPASERNAPAVKLLLADLDRTTTSYGSIITPAYDREGKAAAALLRLVAPTGGFFFSHQSFYDANGARILGDPADPPKLGPR